MKKLLENRKLQKLFLPLALLCIIPVWVMLRNGAQPGVPVYCLAALGVLFFLLDRIFKPRELERAERKLEETKEALSEDKPEN